MSIKVKGLKEVFSEESIQKRVKEMAEEISRDYAGQELLVVCLLKGAVFFFADLTKSLKLSKVKIDFMRVSSYGSDTKSSHEVRFVKDVEQSVKDCNVLIVEDVIDSGLTMNKVFEHFKLRGAKSIKLAAFIDKKERRECEVKIDYTGFALDKGFIVGYGLDLNEEYRQLPGIYEVILEDD